MFKWEVGGAGLKGRRYSGPWEVGGAGLKGRAVVRARPLESPEE